MRLPTILTRGQTALAAKMEPATDGVTVTATERKFSFSLPMNDPRIEGSLYGVAATLARAGSDVAPVPQSAAPAQHVAGRRGACRRDAVHRLARARHRAAAVRPDAGA